MISSISLNETRSRMAYKRRRLASGKARREFVIRDLDGNRERVIPVKAFRQPPVTQVRIAGWMPDNRTLHFRSLRRYPPRELKRFHSGQFLFESLHLLDSESDEPPRTIRVTELFERLRERGQLRRSAGTAYCYDAPVYPGQGKRLRFFATFPSRVDSQNPRADRSSLWDLDVETRELIHVMDLDESAVYGSNAVCSPDGMSVVAALTSEPIEDNTVALVLYRVGRPPRRLPFRLGWLAAGRRTSSLDLGSLFGHINFIDNDTLLYTPSGCEIWLFDLRSWKSELLWRPEAAEARMQNEKRTTDNEE